MKIQKYGGHKNSPLNTHVSSKNPTIFSSKMTKIYYFLILLPEHEFKTFTKTCFWNVIHYNEYFYLIFAAENVFTHF